MLLAKKAHPVQHLAGAAAGFLQARLEARVFALELLDSLGAGAGRSGRGLERFYTRFRVDGTPAK